VNKINFIKYRKISILLSNFNRFLYQCPYQSEF